MIKRKISIDTYFLPYQFYILPALHVSDQRRLSETVSAIYISLVWIKWGVTLCISRKRIVMCKDCKWRGKVGCVVTIFDGENPPKDDDFCSWGKRREEEEDE